MNNGRPIDDWQRPLDFLAVAPLEWLIRFALIPRDRLPPANERSGS